MLTLYDAPRCPFAARARITLAEKGLEAERVLVDLDDRPAWIYEKNPLGRVPVLEEGDFVLPESRVIMEYLEETRPEPALLPRDPAARAFARLQIERFDRLSEAYYALRRGEPGGLDRLQERLVDLDGDLGGRDYVGGDAYGLADIAYVPWILRARHGLGVDLSRFRHLGRWLDRVGERPAVAAEVETVAGLARV